MIHLSSTERPRRLALVTDFGRSPYVGQIALLHSAGAPTAPPENPAPVPLVELISDLVPFRPDLSGFLLPGLIRGMPSKTLYLCIVDPGVGSERDVLALQCGDDWWLGPDNGLLLPMIRRLGSAARVWRVLWRPQGMSASFHGRDLFLPIAHRILAGKLPEAETADLSRLVGADWPAESAAICYVDHYGNLMVGTDAGSLDTDQTILAAGRRLYRARTFSDVPCGGAFWYRNAFGLVEIAVNQGRADNVLGLAPGDSVVFI